MTTDANRSGQGAQSEPWEQTASLEPITPDDAFLILNEWRERAAILQLWCVDARVQNFRPFWVQVSRLIFKGGAAVILTKLSDGFPFIRGNLAGTSYSYGDHRQFSQHEELARYAERGWVCFLGLEMPSGAKIVLAEARRETSVEDFA
jgi:hypothetical protein